MENRCYLSIYNFRHVIFHYYICLSYFDNNDYLEQRRKRIDLNWGLTTFVTFTNFIYIFCYQTLSKQLGTLRSSYIWDNVLSNMACPWKDIYTRKLLFQKLLRRTHYIINICMLSISNCMILIMIYHFKNCQFLFKLQRWNFFDKHLNI